MILETNTVTILIDDLTSVFHIRILVDNRGGRLQHIDKEEAYKET
jgi:hypothetical protein